MSRPRTDEPRQHQINVRFTAREFARLHHHASLTGKTVADFGRAVMLRRPRLRTKAAPALIALPPEALARWQALGASLNVFAHHLNATHAIAAPALAPLVKRLRLLLRRSFPRPCDGKSPMSPYTLAPAARYHLRKVCVNLVQIADLYRGLGLLPPLSLSHLIARFRAVLNGDRPARGP